MTAQEHTQDVLWDTAPARLVDYPNHAVDAFFFGTAEQEARRHDAWFRSVAYINSKNAFMRVPVPLTIPFDRVSAIGPDTIATAPYPCYIKAAISVSGVGIYRCEDQAALADALGRFDPSTPVQIQQEVVTDIFLNMQYEAGPFGLTRHRATEQILDGPVHQGSATQPNTAPGMSASPWPTGCTRRVCAGSLPSIWRSCQARTGPNIWPSNAIHGTTGPPTPQP